MYAKALSVGIHVWHVKCMDMLSIISITIKNKTKKIKESGSGVLGISKITTLVNKINK